MLPKECSTNASVLLYEYESGYQTQPWQLPETVLAWIRRRFPRFEIHQMPSPVSLFNLTSQLSSGVNDGKNASNLGFFSLAGSDRPGAFVWERTGVFKLIYLQRVISAGAK